MPWILKNFQARCLDELASYLARAAQLGAAAAFTEKTGRPYRDLVESPGLPYVCIRVPTGGGKTLMAAHSLGVAQRQLLRADTAIVLWLAPTSTIVAQTLAGLRDPRHPYRRALEESCSGPVEVMGVGDALALNRGTVLAGPVVIVATIQSLRVEKTEGRRVYEDNGALQAHFSGVPPSALAGLDLTQPGGRPIYSLANVLRMHRPIMIVDEAHNARTALSFEMLARLNPACAIEFTATPATGTNASNVLTSVSAAELKAESMIKLPVRLESREQWREALAAALSRREALEASAQEEYAKTGEYIRPIVLIQAQSHGAGDRITVEPLRQALIAEFNVPEDQIADGTGDGKALPEDLLSPSCPVRFVITMNKLREGWDCPFAYVLCSVSNLSSAGAVEQILGRILRLPSVIAKKHPDLNRAYAFTTSTQFAESAQTLRDALVESGFERYEAQASIEPGTFDFGATPLFSEPVEEIFAQPPRLDLVPEDLRAAITVHTVLGVAEGAENSYRVTYSGPPITAESADKLRDAAAPEDRQAVDRLRLKSAGQASWPAALGVEFTVPQIAVVIDGRAEIFEDQFRDTPWKLSTCDARLSEAEFPSNDPAPLAAEFDVAPTGKIQYEFVKNLQDQLQFQDSFAPASAVELAIWLDRNIRHDDIVQTEAVAFLLSLVNDLESRRGIPIAQLAASRFRLRDAAEAKIDNHRRTALKTSYQTWLNGEFGEIRTGSSPEACFSYPSDNYPAPRNYDGPIKFARHFYQFPGEMNGEEAQCAAVIDSLPGTETWVRNLERQERYSFWLQTATDKFYPDFVVKLRDGRTLVVEYKGEDRLSNEDSREKTALGQLWAERSNGAGIFILAGKKGLASRLRQAVGPATSGTAGAR